MANKVERSIEGADPLVGHDSPEIQSNRANELQRNDNLSGQKTGSKWAGILFSAPMVRALLAGHKTQTRRVVARSNSSLSVRWMDLDWSHSYMDPGLGAGGYLKVGGPDETIHRVHNRLIIGDRFWVRETWGEFKREPGRPVFRADDERALGSSNPWRPAIHMPFRYSRIWLEITGVRAERLKDISEADAQDEGIRLEAYETVRGLRRPGYRFGDDQYAPTAREAYALLWDSLNKKRGFGWFDNPWVWVYTFRRIESAKAVA